MPTDRDMFRAMGRECVAFRVRRASRLVSRRYDRCLADAGLSAVQLTLLCAVANRPDLRQAELADVLGFEPSSLSRAMALLVGKRWLKACPTTDKRERFFEITERGKAVCRAAYGRWCEAQEQLRARLGAAELDAALRALDVMGGTSVGATVSAAAAAPGGR